MGVFGRTGYPPYLVFFVPLTTQGVIIPDLNAVPLNQIQFGSGNFAPPGGPWGFTLAKTTNLAGVCPVSGGYDDETPKLFRFSSAWLSVPLAGTNTVSVSIQPANVVNQITFDASGSTDVSVSPTQAASVTQAVQVVGLASTTNLPILYTRGYGAQNSYTTTCSTVALDVLPIATSVTVAVYRVTASIPTNSPTPTNVPLQTDLKSYLDEVYGKQANVFMTVLPVTNIVVNYDLNTNGLLDVDTSTDVLFAEGRAITNVAYRAGALNVYYVKALTNLTHNTDKYGITHIPSRTSYIQDSHPDSNVHIAAHELGHSLAGLLDVDGTTVPGYSDRLMWGVALSSSPYRLIQSEWHQINKKARGQ